ncbi:MAG: 4Fe-4S dicluster domain-containing protein [Bacteroidales bacterium]|nr:4Fe-4S dicluster domain-containing protein [Bacteroidales bacterium]
MDSSKEHTVFHHALKVVPELCIGCTHCMKVCPTQAIRVRNGLAEIFEERCVDCGECNKACPTSAIIVEQDDFEEIFRYKARVALLPSVLIGQFPSAISTEEIFGALKKLGFTHIFETDSVVDLVQEGYNRFIEKFEGEKPVISTFCPAIVRLIQVRFPSMVNSLIRVKAPSEIAAIDYKKKLIEEGYENEEIGLFYVTPCAAKIASVKSPVGEASSAFNGVINMEFLYNKMLHLILNKEVEAEHHDSESLTPKGILWTLTRGESRNQKGRSLAVDGISNVTQFLERLEESEGSNFDFLELRACDESCAGGVLISGNRFLTVERLYSRAKKLTESDKQRGEVYDPALFDVDPIPERPMMVLDSDRRQAIEKMKKMDELLKVLPGIDCAACGSPTCKSLAEDVVQERAVLSSCVFLQELYLRKGKITLDEADHINAAIWGKDRDYRSQSK